MAICQPQEHFCILYVTYSPCVRGIYGVDLHIVHALYFLIIKDCWKVQWAQGLLWNTDTLFKCHYHRLFYVAVCSIFICRLAARFHKFDESGLKVFNTGV